MSEQSSSSGPWGRIIDGEAERKGTLPPTLTITALECEQVLAHISVQCRTVLERDHEGAAGKLYAALTTLAKDRKSNEIEASLLNLGVTDRKELEAHREKTGANARRQERQAAAYTTLSEAAALIEQATGQGVVAGEFVNELHNAITTVVAARKSAHRTSGAGGWRAMVAPDEPLRGEIPSDLFLTASEARRIISSLSAGERQRLRALGKHVDAALTILTSVGGMDESGQLILLDVPIAHPFDGPELKSLDATMLDEINEVHRGRQQAQVLAISLLPKVGPTLCFVHEELMAAPESDQRTQALRDLTALHNAITDVVCKSQGKSEPVWGRG